MTHEEQLAQKKEELLELVADCLANLWMNSEDYQKVVFKVRQKIRNSVDTSSVEGQKLLEETLSSIPTQPSEVKPRKRVVFVGLNSEQFQEMEKALPHLKLKNIQVIEGKTPSLSAAKKADLVVVMTKFISHTTYGKVKKDAAHHEVEFLHHNNGVTSLKQVLQEKFREA